MSLLPSLRVLDLGGRTDIDLPLASAIHEHKNLLIATIDYTDTLSLPPTMPFSRIQLNSVSLHFPYQARLWDMHRYMSQGVTLRKLGISMPEILRDGFDGLSFHGLRRLEVFFHIQSNGDIILSWLSAFISTHGELTEIYFRDGYEGVSWISTPYVPWAHKIVEAATDVRLSDAFSLLDITIRPSCSGDWVVCGLSMSIKCSVLDVLELIRCQCPFLMTLNMTTAIYTKDINPVCCPPCMLTTATQNYVSGSIYRIIVCLHPPH